MRLSLVATWFAIGLAIRLALGIVVFLMMWLINWESAMLYLLDVPTLFCASLLDHIFPASSAIGSNRKRGICMASTTTFEPGFRLSKLCAGTRVDGSFKGDGARYRRRVPSHSLSCKVRHWIFPVPERGNASVNATCRGTLYAAMCCLHQATMSSPATFPFAASCRTT